MSIDLNFLKTAKDQLKAARSAGLSFARANPHLSAGSAAAMVLAPTLFDNDNRGYFATSALTTPVIAAATYVAPGFFSGMKDSKKKFATSIEEAFANQQAAKSGPVSYAEMVAARNAHSNGSMTSSAYSDITRRFMSNKRKAPLNDKFMLRQRESISRRIAKLVEDGFYEENAVFLSNAVHASKLTSLGPGPLEDYLATLDPFKGSKFTGKLKDSPIAWKSVAPMLGDQELLGVINEMGGNNKFLSSFQSKLSQMHRFTVPSQSSIASKYTINPIHRRGWSELSDEQIIRFKTKHTKVYNRISSGIKSGTIDIHKLGITADANGRFHTLTYADHNAVIELADSKGRLVRGKHHMQTGVARHFYTQSELMLSDEYQASLLARGMSDKVDEAAQSANIYTGIEPDDNWSTFGHTDNSALSRENIALRPKQAIRAQHYGWGPEGNSGFDSLTIEQQLEAQARADSLHGFTAVSSEGGAAKGVRELGEVKKISFWGAVDPNKQNSTWRYATKPAGLANVPLPVGGENIVRSTAPFAKTDYLESLDAKITPREVGTRITNISATQKNIFADLPENIKDITREQELQIVQKMFKEGKVSRKKAGLTWLRIKNMLEKDADTFQAIRKFGYLGEGSLLLERNLHGMHIEQVDQLDVTDFRVPNWHEHIGKSLESVYGPNTVIGFDNGHHVFGRGQENFIQNAHQLPNGKTRVEILRKHAIDSGAKSDMRGSSRGQVQGIYREEVDKITDVLNAYHKGLDTGDYIPRDVTGFQIAHYSAGKANSVEAATNVTADLLRRLQEHGQLSEANAHLEKLYETGVYYNPESGSLIFKGGTLDRYKTDELYPKGMDAIRDMMGDVGGRIKSGAISLKESVHDKFLTAFKNSDKDYMSFAQANANPVNLSFTLPAGANDADKIKVTYDMKQQLAMRDMHGVVEDLSRHSTIHGDTSINARMADYLTGKDPNAIQKVVPFEEALSNGEVVILSQGESRRHSNIFSGNYKDNVLIQYPDGSKVPMLGNDAYGGHINQYGAGEYAASELEKSLNNLTEAHLQKKDLATIEKLRQAHLDNLASTIHGKDSYLRAENDYKFGISGSLQARTSNLKYEGTNERNIFQIGVDPEMIDHLPKRMRKQIKKGNAYSIFQRHPVENAPAFQLALDENLRGSRQIGVDPEAMHLASGDTDGDKVFAYVMDHATHGMHEAKSRVIDPKSLQRLDVEYMKTHYDTDEFIRHVSPDKARLKNALERAAEFSLDFDRAMLARSTSSTVGAFSNTLTMAAIGLDANKNILKAAERSELSSILFKTVRQAAINSRKHGSTFNQQNAMTANNLLNKSMSESGNFDNFFNNLKRVGAMTNQKMVDHIESRRELFQRMYEGADWKSARQSMHALTDSEETLLKTKTYGSLGMPEGAMPYLRDMESATAREAVAATQGAINDAIRSTPKKASKVFEATETLFQDAKRVVSNLHGGSLKTIGLGVAAAAGLGVLATSLNKTTPEASFGRTSSARYRPEEQGQASPEVGTGSMAASPARNVYPAQEHVRTAVTAPLGETRDLDVQLRANDQASAHEKTKIISRLSTNGDSHVTVNYKGRMKPGSLRTREKVRDILDK